MKPKPETEQDKFAKTISKMRHTIGQQYEYDKFMVFYKSRAAFENDMLKLDETKLIADIANNCIVSALCVVFAFTESMKTAGKGLTPPAPVEGELVKGVAEIIQNKDALNAIRNKSGVNINIEVDK